MFDQTPELRMDTNSETRDAGDPELVEFRDELYIGKKCSIQTAEQRVRNSEPPSAAVHSL